MAHNIEPMEIDTIENELEDKENIHHGNFVSKTACTEKGYEELNVSELNMKLRYSITPSSSPMSKSVTLNCTEGKNYDRGDNCFFNNNETFNMSKSLNSTATINETVKTIKTLPLKPLPPDHIAEGVKQVLRPLDSHIINCVDVDNAVSPATIEDGNFSLPSSSSSIVNTPEATTPTKEMAKHDDGSPILRGLKSVLSMFRTSQSPVNNEKVFNDNLTSPSSSTSCIHDEDQKVIASTPVQTIHSKVSPFRESIVFKDDLEKELQWKDDTTIIFSQERIPAHKLFPPLELKTPNTTTTIDKEEMNDQNNLNNTTMSMDISLYYNDSSIGDITMAENNTVTNISTAESDNEFVDCETTFKEESSIKESTLTNNLTKTIDAVKEIESETTSIIDNKPTLDLLQNTECKQRSPILDAENKCQLNVQNDVNISNYVISPETEKSVFIDVKPEVHIDTTAKDIDVSTRSIQLDIVENKNINNKSEISSVMQNQNVECVNVVGSQSNITLIEENTSIKQTENEIQGDMLQMVENQHEAASVQQENKNDELKIVGNEVAKELAEFELMNYDMSMTIQASSQENDTTINVISNIDTIVQDYDEDKVKTLLNETLQDFPVNKQESEEPSNHAINIPNSSLDLPNNSNEATKLSATGDTINSSVTDIGDKKCEDTINNKSLSSCVIKSTLKDDTTFTDNMVANTDTNDTTDKCETIKLSNDDEKIECIDNFDIQDNKQIFESHSPSNTQTASSEDSFLREKSLIDKTLDQNHSPVREVSNLEVTNNDTTTANNFETIGKPTLTTDEEIIVSENNSPYVSLSANVNDVEDQIPEKFEESENPFANSSKIVLTPPISPKIQFKGYNFNFDEIDDPFATKTKIRMSPQPDDVNGSINIENNLETSTTYKKKPPQKKQKNVMSVQKDEFQEDYKAVHACNTSNDQTKVIFTAPNFSVSNSTFDITNELDKNKSKEDLLLDGQDSETFSSTTFNIITAESTELETQDLQVETNSSELVSKDSDCNAIDINSILPEKDDPLEYNKEQPCVVTNSLDTFSSSTFNITTDVIMAQENVDKRKPSMTLNDRVSLNTTTTFDNDVHSSYQDKMILSDKSAYFSATPSSSSSSSKNVFNIPEINETFISSEATTEIQQSFTLNKDAVLNDSNDFNVIATNNEDNSEELNCSNLSKMTEDKNDTVREINIEEEDVVREINTEDEDTIEGPFLEPDDLNTIDKVPDSYDQKQEIMQFMDLNPAEIDENPEGGEIFIDAKAYEFLLNQNITNAVSDCGRESLFLKFDPLFAKRISSAGVSASSPKNMQNTMIKPSTSYDELPRAGTSSEPIDIYSSDPFENKISESINSTTKPTMVVTPAVNSVVPKNQASSPPRSNRRSFTLTSPAIAVIDKLLSISGNNSLLGQETIVDHNEQHESEQTISTQIRELLAEKELQFRTMKSESCKVRDRLSDLEAQVEKLEKEGQARLNNINALNKELADRTKENRNMAAVVEEYERTIASLIAERVQEKKQRDEERKQLIQERDEQIAHLTNMESSFNDLHSKYEKSKQIILGFKTNEDAYKKTLADFEENLAKMQSNYELLKQHATSKLNHANQELEKMNKTHAAEVLKLKAMFKRKELEISSLEDSLAQKTKANDELAAICDELINKVG